MKCDQCDLKATVFLTQLMDGKVKKICLCEKCSNEQGVTDPTGFSLTNILQQSFSSTLQPSQSLSDFAFDTNPTKCPSCSFTLENMRKVQRLGCPSCYQTFGSELHPILSNLHKGNQHVGKVPQGLFVKEVRAKRLEELQLKLKEAIILESYETAASIRDEIQNLDCSNK